MDLEYAAKVKKNPKLSLVYEEDQYWRDLHENKDPELFAAPKAAWISFGILVYILILFSVNYPTSSLQIGNSTVNGLPVIPALTALFALTSYFSLKKTVHLYILNILFFTIFFFSVVVLFLCAGILTPKEMLEGFSNKGMITVAMLFLVSEGIRQSGALGQLIKKLLPQGKTTVFKAQLRMLPTFSFISAFLNNLTSL